MLFQPFVLDQLCPPKVAVTKNDQSDVASGTHLLDAPGGLYIK